MRLRARDGACHAPSRFTQRSLLPTTICWSSGPHRPAQRARRGAWKRQSLPESAQDWISGYRYTHIFTHFLYICDRIMKILLIVCEHMQLFYMERDFLKNLRYSQFYSQSVCLQRITLDSSVKLTSSFSINPVLLILSAKKIQNDVKMSFLLMHAQWWFICNFRGSFTPLWDITSMDIVYIIFQQVRKIIYTDQSSGYLLLICLSKALMTLIQHTETTACTFTQPPTCSHSQFHLLSGSTM